MGTHGDAFAVVFPRAGSAIAAAADAQRSLAAGPVRVRMGCSHRRAFADRRGLIRRVDVHQAARSRRPATADRSSSRRRRARSSTARFELRDLGEHRLKDIGAPVRLFQLGRDQFRLSGASARGLPIEPSALLGREEELDDLLRLLGGERTRLVTLTGPGGIGKTSLAVAAAAELVESFEDGSASWSLRRSGSGARLAAGRRGPPARGRCSLTDRWPRASFSSWTTSSRQSARQRHRGPARGRPEPQGHRDEPRAAADRRGARVSPRAPR